MALLTVQRISRAGLDRTLVNAASGGDTFPNDGQRTFFYVRNADSTATTVTFVTPGTIDGLAIGDLAISVGANKDFMIGPFPAALYNDINGLVQVTYSKVTSLTVNPFML